MKVDSGCVRRYCARAVALKRERVGQASDLVRDLQHLRLMGPSTVSRVVQSCRMPVAYLPRSRESRHLRQLSTHVAGAS